MNCDAPIVGGLALAVAARYDGELRWPLTAERKDYPHRGQREKVGRHLHL
jgi:hypothetical protein